MAASGDKEVADNAKDEDEPPSSSFLLLSPPSLWRTRTAFLRCVALCFLSAFASLYPQVEGLYGPKGILPAERAVKAVDDFSVPNVWKEGPAEFLEKVRPNVLKLVVAWTGLRADLAMDFLCLVGMLLSLVMTIRPGWCHKANFLLVWLCYKSLYDVGQTFLWFQWDILLLETGFLCLIVAPLTTISRFGLSSYTETSPWDRLGLFLVRWLLFRMMFASGVVKLLSQCEAWWGLTALPVHYESQCIPTWLAWYAYLLPDFVHKLSVIATYAIEIPFTLLFFAPTKELKVFTFKFQILLMLSIMLTGNYNFFNILYMGLCLSLMDDTWLEDSTRSEDPPAARNPLSRLRTSFNRLVYVALLVGTCFYFVKFDSKTWAVELTSKFSLEEFQLFVQIVGEGSVGAGLVLLAYHSFRSVVEAVLGRQQEKGGGGGGGTGRKKKCGVAKKGFHVAVVAVYVFVAFVLFGVSTPRYLIGMNSRNVPHIPKEVLDFGKRIGHLEVAHSYGLFRRMTGVGGRPEVVIEGSAGSQDGPWQEFNFKYKPGLLDGTPPFIIPHQPRLDWQMWFAALGSYQHNPWFVSLVYRLLENEPDVVQLLDEERHPFQREKSPKFVRALLYHYHFTNSTEAAKTGNWWKRELKGEYFPTTGKVASSSSVIPVEQLKEFLKTHGFIGPDGDALRSTSFTDDTALFSTLSSLRRLVARVPHHLFVQSTLLAAIPLVWAMKGGSQVAVA